MRVGNNFLKGRLNILLILIIHIGPAMYDNGILTMLINIDICHAGRLILQNPPIQLYVGLFHLIFDPMHGVVVAHLSDEPALA